MLLLEKNKQTNHPLHKLRDGHLAMVLYDEDTAIVSLIQVIIQGSCQALVELSKEESHINDRPKTKIMDFLDLAAININGKPELTK